jgi:hypothetical protein
MGVLSRSESLRQPRDGMLSLDSSSTSCEL